MRKKEGLEVCSSHLGLFPSPLQRRPFGGNSQRTVLCGSLGLLDNDGGLRIPTCRAQGIDSRGWSLSDTAASSTREAVCVASQDEGCLVNQRTLLKEEVILKRIQTL